VRGFQIGWRLVFLRCYEFCSVREPELRTDTSSTALVLTWSRTPLRATEVSAESVVYQQLKAVKPLWQRLIYQYLSLQTLGLRL
jgi:hypothetical protein